MIQPENRLLAFSRNCCLRFFDEGGKINGHAVSDSQHELPLGWVRGATGDAYTRSTWCARHRNRLGRDDIEGRCETPWPPL